MYEIKEHSEITYSLLVGPGNFECTLGEPEDCNWYRDGSEALKRLNALHEFACYWSYCTRQGIEKECPEKHEQFKIACIDLGIPYP